MHDSCECIVSANSVVCTSSLTIGFEHVTQCCRTAAASYQCIRTRRLWFSYCRKSLVATASSLVDAVMSLTVQAVLILAPLDSMDFPPSVKCAMRCFSTLDSSGQPGIRAVARGITILQHQVLRPGDARPVFDRVPQAQPLLVSLGLHEYHFFML